ncbi:MAG: zinc ribbon domain-containing protein [Chloroflexi bacterium]|nr:zinc ribbon domain-containing protein [Chloroflexota bacterium]
MPVYEYRCGDCKQRVGIFQTYAEYGKKKVNCPNCGSEALTRIISRVRVAKSEDARLESMSDPSNFGDLDENDPKSMAKFMKKMGAEMGEDLGPEFNEVVDRMEAGESPESIEQTMPELGGAGEAGLNDEY